MKNNAARWVIALAVLLLLLLLLGPPLLPPRKARAQRVQSVNQVVRPFPESAFVLTNVAVTNAATPASTP